jgi:hypothetical protein
MFYVAEEIYLVAGTQEGHLLIWEVERSDISGMSAFK